MKNGYTCLNYLINPDYSQRNLIVSKAKVKEQVKRMFIRCTRYFSFNAAQG